MKYGFKKDIYKPEDHIFGASGTPFEAIQPNGDWSEFLPAKEYQNLNNVEPYACVTFTILNCVEILIKKQYGIDSNFSDRFLAAISGTKEGGNSPQVVCQFLRDIGVVPQDVWPFDSSIDSFEKFYAPIPPAIRELANEFKTQWDFRYKNVNPNGITSALTCSPLLISVPAWSERGGKYYRPEGAEDNHATTLFYQSNFRRVFDSYADGKGDPAIKDLELSLIPSTIKVFQIKKKNIEVQLNLIQRIIDKIRELITLLIKQKTMPKPIQDTPDHHPKLAIWAKEIERQEGGRPEHRNMRNHNPGNLKYTSYTASLGAVDKDSGNFCIFPAYEQGFNALCQFLLDACNNQLKHYKDSTLDQFTKIYANPLSRNYVRGVARVLGVNIDIKIKDLL